MPSAILGSDFDNKEVRFLKIPLTPIDLAEEVSQKLQRSLIGGKQAFNN